MSQRSAKRMMHSGFRHRFISLTLFFSIVSAVSLSGCKKKSAEAGDEIRITGSTMGTSYSVVIRKDSPFEKSEQEKLSELIQRELDRIDSIFSNWKGTSDISRFNDAQAGDIVPVSPEFTELIRTSAKIKKLTGGVFDPTVGPLIEIWGFGKKERTHFPDNKEVKSALNRVGLEHIKILRDNKITKENNGIQLNLSAIAKGHGVDTLFRLLRRNGYEHILVEVGGEIRGSISANTSDSEIKGWRIGVEKPEYENRRTLFGVIEITDGAMATSGDYRNYFEYQGKRYSHIIDPRTGLPGTSDVVSATVVGPECAVADGLATSLIVLESQEGIALLERLKDYEGLLLVRNGDSFLPKTTSGMGKYLTAKKK